MGFSVDGQCAGHFLRVLCTVGCSMYKLHSFVFFLYISCFTSSFFCFPQNEFVKKCVPLINNVNCFQCTLVQSSVTRFACDTIVRKCICTFLNSVIGLYEPKLFTLIVYISIKQSSNMGKFFSCCLFYKCIIC